MYHCLNCYKNFDAPIPYKERYGFNYGSYVTLWCCPHCGVDNEFEEVEEVED